MDLVRFLLFFAACLPGSALFAMRAEPDRIASSLLYRWAQQQKKEYSFLLSQKKLGQIQACAIYQLETTTMLRKNKEQHNEKDERKQLFCFKQSKPPEQFMQFTTLLNNIIKKWSFPEYNKQSCEKQLTDEIHILDALIKEIYYTAKNRELLKQLQKKTEKEQTIKELWTKTTIKYTLENSLQLYATLTELLKN